MQADGSKSPVTPLRQTLRGPHDWASRGLVWISPYDSSGEVIACEGVEDALTLAAAGAANVAAFLGISRLRKVCWPWGVRKVTIARDDDPPGSPGDNALYRAVVRQRGAGLKVEIMVRPRLLASGANVAIKDANDVWRHDPAKVTAWLGPKARAGTEDLGPEARNAALDEISLLPNEQYELGRKANAAMLGFARVKVLDDVRIARIAERDAVKEDDEETEEIWPDPVTDIAEVLDDAAIEIGRYLKASPEAIDAVVLWCAGAHVLQRNDLRINISPRLYINSPVPGCGKTLLLEIIMALTPRSMMLSSISVAGLFREIDAHRPTLGLDEFDKQMDGASQEYRAILNSGHRKSSAFVLRMEKTDDGQFVRVKFSTFTAMAFSGLKKLPDDMTARCIIVALQRASADDNLEHLIDGTSEKLVEIRRKLARWAKDVTDLPMVSRPKALANRLGDNWYTIRRIGTLAGETWARRATDAAMKPSMTADTNVTLALLDAIWRVFDETKRLRMPTEELLSELKDMDEGRWSEEHRGKPITAYFLRDTLGDMVPANAEKIAPRRWVTGSIKHWGYDVLHLEDAFLRYLGKGLPGGKADKGVVSGQTARENTQKHPVHPVHPVQTPNNEGSSDTYSGPDSGLDSGLDKGLDASATSAPGLGDCGDYFAPTSSPLSSPPSGPEKSEQIAATPGVGLDGLDGLDQNDPLRALFEGGPAKHKKGGARRTPRQKK